MAINFNSFTTGTVGGANPIQTDDFVVGFDTAVPGGERKWAITTLANAVSGVISPNFQPVGGGSDKVFYENDKTVNSNYTISSNKNAMTAGPITVASGVTVTVPSGSTWTVV